eukprot:TRINITY_DN2554_c0_g1_i1.p1 TRINITY_DN2554_c0_g1~~TRINITY_DN2554_c0_g1_i1.p1  ORF type:complete len:305 (+),score=54.33 TRINITY_DN2554_c0_g1_i1:65-916(+)
MMGDGGSKKPPPGTTKGLLFVGAALGLGALALNSFYTVQAGHKAIKFNILSGLARATVGPGMHVRIPIIEWPIIYDCRARPFEIAAKSGSRDLQEVEMTIRILHKPGENLPELYRLLGMEYNKRLLISIGNEVMKAVLAQFNVSELLIRREEVSARINELLRNRCKTYHVDVEDVSIVHLQFGKEYSAAVESKQVAQQLAERGRFQVEQALQEKKSKIVLAQGEAESARLIGESLRKAPGFIRLRQIEAAKEIAHTLAKSKNRVYLDSETLLLNVVNLDRLDH